VVFVGKKVGTLTVGKGVTRALFFGSLADDKLTKIPVSLAPGMYLSGSLTLIKDYTQVTEVGVNTKGGGQYQGWGTVSTALI